MVKKYSYQFSCYNGVHTKVKILCLKHGIFEQTPDSHVRRGNACPKCKLKDISAFVKDAIEIHGNKYSYTNSVYINHKTKIEIICKKHGSFWQTPATHLWNKSGCKKCGTIESHLKTTKTQKKFLEDVRKIHGNKYDYSRLNYINDKEKIEIICKKHGSFWQKANGHLHNECGCPKCKRSKGEEKIAKFLDSVKMVYFSQFKHDKCKDKRRLAFDFYLPKHNLCIEYDGEQHFEPMIKRLGEKRAIEVLRSVQRKDVIKNDFCKKYKIDLLRISYIQHSEIEKILSKKLDISFAS